MKAILKREWNAYFQNIIGWLYLAATAALYGLYFFVYNLNYGYAKVSYALNAITFLYLITVPVLTMRSLAEEQKSKTDQLILTAPVSVGKIVLAKYLAMAAVHTLACVTIAVTPLLLMMFGAVSAAESYAGVLGFYLYGLVCIAIGLFVSSLTESQVISAVLTFVFLFFGFMMPSITGLISASGNFLTRIFGCYDLVTPLSSFLDGCLSVTGIIYYLTVSALFLFLTAQSIQKRRFTVSTRKLKLGVFSAGYAASAVALTVVVNLFVAELPSTYMELDMTASKLYSLTEETETLLKNLKKDVTIYAITSENGADTTVAETLKRYEDSSSHIKVEYKDPAVNPNFYRDYTEENISLGTLIVTCGDVSKVIDAYDLYETEVDYSTYSQKTTGYDGEGQITSAILYVTNDNMPVIYEITGHGETPLAGNFTKAVEKANVTLKSMNLLDADEVPKDAQAVIINGPSSDFSKDDVKKVTAYLKGGGNVLVTANYEAQEEMKNFSSILAEYDMAWVDGVVAEGDTSRFYQNPFYLLPEVASSSYTASVGSDYIFAPFVQGITFPESGEEITYTALLTASGQAVSKTDAGHAETFSYEEGDIKGPFTVAAAAEKTEDGEVKGRLAAFGSYQIFTDSADQMVSGHNLGMFSDLLSVFAGTGETPAVVIPVKSYENTQLTVSAFAGRLIGLSMILAFPALLIATGVTVWIRRRKR